MRDLLRILGVLEVIVFRIFLYITIPFLLLGLLKSSRAMDMSYLEEVTYVIPTGVVLSYVIGILKNDLRTLSNNMLNKGLVCLTLIWLPPMLGKLEPEFLI